MPVLGGGGGASFFGQTLEATASGAIADGDPIILNADGTVSAVSATGAVVSPVGGTMFVVGITNDTVFRYELTTAFDVSTASYPDKSFSVSSEDTAPTGVAFSSDGLKMFVSGDNLDRINEYGLTSAYDITTASFTQFFSVFAQDSQTQDIAFNSDGTKMFVLGAANDRVYEYDLSTGFDLSSASYSGTNFSVNAEEVAARGLAFSADGTKMFIVGTVNDRVYQYNLGTGFDLSTASYSGTSLNVSSQEPNPESLRFNSDGTKMYVIGLTNDSVREYDLSVGFDLSTASYSGRTFSVTSQENQPTGLAFGGLVLGTNLTTADSYIGIADGAYADGTTATIQLVGSVDDAQSGLTPGAIHYVQTDGSLSTTPDTLKVEAGYAISATELVVKGAYSTVTAPEYTPTPLDDAIPQQFQVNSAGNLLLYSGASVYDDSGTNFWSYINLQGAFIINATPTAYTEIVNVTGSGMLGTIVTGALDGSDDDIFIEVTIDDEVREWRIFADAFWRGILTFSLYNGWSKSGGMLAATPASFDPTYTTVYSARDTTNATTDIAYLSPTSLSQGIRFKSNMKVRIKSATSFAATSLRDRHGVLYVID